MAEHFPIYHEGIEIPGTSTQRAYDAIWYPLGWRKSRPKSSSSAEESNQQADETAETQEVPE